MTAIKTPAGLIRAEVDLAALDGNAMVLVGTVRRELRLAGNSKAVIDAFSAEALSGTYDHVLQTCMAYTERP